jgi:hypothetical protein
MRTVLSENPRQEHKEQKRSSVSASRVERPKWYSSAYLAQVFARRPAQLLALLAFIIIAGVLIYVFAAGQESSNLNFNTGTLSGTTYNSANQTVTLNQNSGSTNHAPQCGGDTSSPPATFDHVIIIMMENHSYSAVVGHAPTYIDPVLGKTCGLSSGMVDSINTNSLPHYIKLTSGYANETGDCSYNASSCHSTQNNIFNQLGSANWKAYQEDYIAGKCTATQGPPGYAARHDPAVFYDDIPGHTCPSNIVSFASGVYNSGSLYTDLQNGTVPKYAFITPTVPDDMHDPGTVASGDTWLSHWMPIILNSKTYTQSNTVVFVWWDEANATNQTLPNYVISPWTGNVKPTQSWDQCTAFHVQEVLLGLSQLACQAGPNDSAGGATSASTIISEFNL